MGREPALNDLWADVAESENVAEEYPGIVKRLARIAADFDKDAG